jgi:hypothetical protein
MAINKNAVKNFHAEVHGLPSPGRNVKITQLLIFLPAETSQSIATFLQVLNEVAC